MYEDGIYLIHPEDPDCEDKLEEMVNNLEFIKRLNDKDK